MFIPGGVGSAGADITNQVFTALGIKDKVDLASVDLNEGVQAVKNRGGGFLHRQHPAGRHGHRAGLHHPGKGAGTQ